MNSRSLTILSALACTAVAAAFVGDDMVAKMASEAKPLQAGAMIPKANVTTLDGKSVSLKDALGGKPTVLVFYRGGWCPFCNRHLAELGKITSELKAKGYQIVGVTPDLPSELKKTMEKDMVEYTLLSDSSADAMKKFGVAFRLDDDTFKMYKGSYNIDLERSSGQNHHILPVPSVFVINKSGKITFAHSNPDYKVRLSGEKILEAASKM